MAEAKKGENLPPKIRLDGNGEADISSLADLLEWFLMYDERTARIRHANTEELFQWKQKDDSEQGITIYPFENAEARFAVGAFQALAENNSEPLLKLWISDLLEALQESHKTKTEIAESYNLDEEIEAFCKSNYGVEFPLSTKVDVNGKETHPVFAFLKERAGGRLGSAIKWNFTKFLVAPDGTTIKRYGPTTKPEAIRADIESLLG